MNNVNCTAILSAPAHPDIDLLMGQMHADVMQFLQDQRMDLVGA